jgi:hypothetical protein
LRAGAITISATRRYTKSPKVSVYPDPDPDVADFIHKEYWSAVIDAQIYRTSSVPQSLSAFTRELQVRCTGLDRV